MTIDIDRTMEIDKMIGRMTDRTIDRMIYIENNDKFR